jgi:divalent metal cation (Fe/Co/Zn/Cd) transporter
MPIAIKKVCGAAFTGSAAMLSEPLHSVGRHGNHGLMLLGVRKNRKRPDFDHPFGYGHELYFSTLVVGFWCSRSVAACAEQFYPLRRQ